MIRPMTKQEWTDALTKMWNDAMKETWDEMSKREWVGLTDDEIGEFDVDPIEAKLLIAKLKEKNT